MRVGLFEFRLGSVEADVSFARVRSHRIEMVVWVAVGAYGAASLLHFLHNAEFCGDYPNLPAWITRGSVWLVWTLLSLLGGAGCWLLRAGWRKSGLGVLAVYGALGCAGLGHYSLAPIARHTAVMNLSIGFEAVAGLALLAVAGHALLGEIKPGSARARP